MTNALLISQLISSNGKISIDKLGDNTANANTYLAGDNSWEPFADQARESVGDINGQITGFKDRTSSLISFDESNRTVTISPTTSSFDVYYRGEKHTYSSNLTFQIDDTSQGHYYSINPETWELYDAGIFGDIRNSINTTYVYWDASNQKALIVGDERHSVTADPEWHYAQHRNVGTIWRSGGGLRYTQNTASAITIAVGSPLVIADEDMEHVITHSAYPILPYQQILTGAASLPVMYLNGTSYVMTEASTTPWVAGTSTARYNPVVDSSGSLSDAGEGKYISYWLVATNSQINPLRLVMGRLANDTIDDAYGETFEGYGISVAEIVALYQIILRTSESYTENVPHVIISAVRTIKDRVAASSTTFTATSHDNLTDRSSENQHPISAITSLQSNLDGKQSTLVSGSNIKTINSTSLLGSGDVAVQPTLVSGTNIKSINSTSLLGSGDLTISTSLSLLSSNTYSTPGTSVWTKPANAKLIKAIIIGAGGGGAGGTASVGSGANGGSGGGGGGARINLLIPASELGSTANVTVGTAGTAGTGATQLGAGTNASTAGGSGGTGGSSSFENYTAKGGLGGTASNTNSTTGPGGAGGCNITNANAAGGYIPTYFEFNDGGTGGASDNNPALIEAIDTVSPVSSGGARNVAGTQTTVNIAGIAGANAGTGTSNVVSGGSAGTAGNNAGGDGNSSSDGLYASGGGSGGTSYAASGSAVRGGAGGNGASPGGGGGSGGAGRNNTNTNGNNAYGGNGGSGGNGKVVIYCYG